MPNYQNGKIYKIESLEGECVYYGSTTQKLCVRMAEHRKHYKIKRGITSEHILCFDDAKIYLVENYQCNSKEELHAREGYYIKNNVCVNKKIPGRTRKEYALYNREDRLKYQKWYRETHKEKVKKDLKEWNEKNREQQIIKRKAYYKNNKHKWEERQQRFIICECGSKVQKHLLRHRRTEKHKTLLSNPFINFKL